MINIIQNTIGALGRVLGIVKKNLQLWLDFNKIEVIGSEEVVNGDFATDSDWTKGTGWSIANGSAICDGTQTSNTSLGSSVMNLRVGGVYKVTVNVSSTSSGFRLYDSESVIDYSLDVGENVFYRTPSTSAYTVTPIALVGSTGSVTNISIKEVTQLVKDKSPNTNNAKLFTGKALSFNGNDSVDIDGFTMSGEFTAAIWFKVGSGQEHIIGLDNSASNQVYLNNGNQVIIKLNGFFTTFNFSTFTDTYQRLIIVRDSSDNLSAYVSDVESTSGSFIKSGNFTIDTFGRSQTNYGLSTLSDFQIYNKAWTASDVTFDYNNPNHLAIDNPDTDLVVTDLKAYWAMSEGDGLVAYDSSGNGNDGDNVTPTSGDLIGATYVDKQPTIPQLGMMDWAKSTPVADEITLIQAPNNKGYDILGNALRLREHAFNLDGSGYAEIADSDSLDFGAGEFSMEAWLVANYIDKGETINVAMTLGGDVAITGTAGLAVKGSTGKIRGYVNSFVCDSDASFTIGQWYHIVLTRSSIGLCELYIDAQKQVDTETTTGTVSNASSKLIGKDSNINRGYEDLIDDTRLYNRALTQKEITHNYKAGINKHKATSSFSDDFSSDYGI